MRSEQPALSKHRARRMSECWDVGRQGLPCRTRSKNPGRDRCLSDIASGFAARFLQALATSDPRDPWFAEPCVVQTLDRGAPDTLRDAHGARGRAPSRGLSREHRLTSCLAHRIGLASEVTLHGACHSLTTPLLSAPSCSRPARERIETIR